MPKIIHRIPLEAYAYFEVIYDSEEEFDTKHEAIMELINKRKTDSPSTKLEKLKQIVGEKPISKFAKIVK